MAVVGARLHAIRAHGLLRISKMALLVSALAGCIGGSGPNTLGETPRPGASPPPATLRPSVSTALGQTCTDAWRAHGHTTQRQAQAFLAQCLADQGAVEQRMNRESVSAVAVMVVPSDCMPTSLVPGDIVDFCPGFVAQDTNGRADFWRALVTAIARPESDFRTTASLWEGGDLNQFSIGLLQLSYTDRSYGCHFNNEADITDPARNLACGARILERLERFPITLAHIR